MTQLGIAAPTFTQSLQPVIDEYRATPNEIRKALDRSHRRALAYAYKQFLDGLAATGIPRPLLTLRKRVFTHYSPATGELRIWLGRQPITERKANYDMSTPEYDKKIEQIWMKVAPVMARIWHDDFERELRKVLVKG